jgi:hypothetical protein
MGYKDALAGSAVPPDDEGPDRLMADEVGDGFGREIVKADDHLGLKLFGYVEKGTPVLRLPSSCRSVRPHGNDLERYINDIGHLPAGLDQAPQDS